MAQYRDSGEDRSLLIAAFAGRVFGLSAATGEVVWEQRMSPQRTVELLVRDDRVYACDGLSLVRFDYASGRELQRTTLPDTYKGRPTIVAERDRIFIGSSGEIMCFNSDCELMWMQPFKGKGMGAVSLGFPGNVRQADATG